MPSDSGASPVASQQRRRLIFWRSIGCLFMAATAALILVPLWWWALRGMSGNVALAWCGTAAMGSVAGPMAALWAWTESHQ